MFSHRLFTALTGLCLVAATFVVATPAASAQDGSTDLHTVLASIGPDSVATGEPVTIVLAGATSRHTLEIAGALAAAVGDHDQPVGWLVAHGPAGVDAPGSVITINDGPGPTAEITAERSGQRSTIALTGNAGELVVMANELAGRSGPASTDVAVPNTWMPDMLAEALGLISELASDGNDSMRLVTDLGVDHTRDLVVVGPAGADRVTQLAGQGAKPTILAYADESAEALAVPRPAPRTAPSDGGLPIVPIGIVIVVLAAGGFAFARRRGGAELVPAAI